MNIWAGLGDTVRFNGVGLFAGEHDAIHASQLEIGRIYTVGYCDVEDDTTTVHFIELPRQGFNSAWFSDVFIDATKALVREKEWDYRDDEKSY
jgi:hypothetical protein